jgi:deazaflavin-dependent oxidoreductase (nitroreductase family)
MRRLRALEESMTDPADFREANALERLFNRAFGVLVGLGLAPADYYLLEVRGRNTGRARSTPVNVIRFGDRRFLVAPRGRTHWVRNVEVAGEVVLKRERSRQRFRTRAVPSDEKPEILRGYLDRFRTTVQRYFPVRAGSDAAAFAPIVGRYPVFELLGDGPAR